MDNPKGNTEVQVSRELARKKKIHSHNLAYADNGPHQWKMHCRVWKNIGLLQIQCLYMPTFWLTDRAWKTLAAQHRRSKHASQLKSHACTAHAFPIVATLSLVLHMYNIWTKKCPYSCDAGGESLVSTIPGNKLSQDIAVQTLGVFWPTGALHNIFLQTINFQTFCLFY